MSELSLTSSVCEEEYQNLLQYQPQLTRVQYSYAVTCGETFAAEAADPAYADMSRGDYRDTKDENKLERLRYKLSTRPESFKPFYTEGTRCFMACHEQREADYSYNLLQSLVKKGADPDQNRNALTWATVDAFFSLTADELLEKTNEQPYKLPVTAVQNLFRMVKLDQTHFDLTRPVRASADAALVTG